MAEVYKTGPIPYESSLRISWGSIFSGAVVALGIQLALNMLGVGLGYGLMVTDENLFSFSTGAGIFMAISAAISLFIGGLVASRTSGSFRTARGVLHGIVMSGLLLTTLYLTVTVGMLIGSLAGKAVSLASLFTPQAGVWAFAAIALGVCAACIGGWLGLSEEAARAAAVEERERKAA